MDTTQIDRIKTLVVIALFSDDELMDMLVLKGGSAVDLIYRTAERASIDVDLSIDGDLPASDLVALTARFGRLLNRTLNEEGYDVFDVKLSPRPPEVSPDFEPFWGGYRLEFKVAASSPLKDAKRNARARRMSALVVGPGHRRNFGVDLSRHEYCKPKAEHILDGYTIYVYTPEMIVCEKLRAICQQMPEYGKQMRSTSQSQRARDFFDIHTLITRFKIKLETPENRRLLRAIFQAKRVPLHLLQKIEETREYHRQGYPALRDSIKPNMKSRFREFDFYFDFVLGQIAKLDGGS